MTQKKLGKVLVARDDAAYGTWEKTNNYVIVCSSLSAIFLILLPLVRSTFAIVKISLANVVGAAWGGWRRTVQEAG